jgi:hypothetical protein
MAFDAGLFSFNDFTLSKNHNKNNIFILVTNPKDIQFKTTNNREPLERMTYSSHIRFLIFSKYDVLSAKVFIDDFKLGQGVRVKPDKPLYVLKWDPSHYRKNYHKLKIVVEVYITNIKNLFYKVFFLN